MIGTEQLKISRREKIEWVNYWWENANDNKKERWLLMGDSVMRQIRGSLNVIAGEQIAIDYFGSSTYVDDELLNKEIKDFFGCQNYRYNVILINLGFHHGMDRNVAELEEDKMNFAKFYEDIIDLCATRCNRIVIISGTPEREKGDLKKYNVKANMEIVARNEVVFELCKSRGCDYVDLYDFFYNRSSQYKHCDHVHFVRKADLIMAKLIYNVVMHNLQDLDERNEMDVFLELDLIKFENIIKEYPICLYGAGEIGNELMKYIELRGGSVSYFVLSDGQEKNTSISGKEVFYVSEKIQELKKRVMILAIKNPLLLASVVANNNLTAYIVSDEILSFVEKYIELSTL